MTATLHRLSTVVLVVLVVLGGVAGVGMSPVAADEQPEATCTYPLVIEDATGTEVELEAPAEEVVVLDAASAQIFWELGAADRVTGMPVAPFTEYLEGSTDRADVLDAEGVVNQEVVIDLDPDLVVAPNFTPDETIEQLRDAGLTVYQSPFEESVDAVNEKAATFGQFVDACDRADRVVDNVQTDFETTEAATAAEDGPLVLYYFDGFIAGQGTFTNDILNAAGATTVADEEEIADFQPISDEVIAEADPEWIVTPAGTGIPEDEEPFASTTAVQEDQVLTVNDDLISQAAPRVVVPLRTISSALYPDVAFDPLNRLDPTVSVSAADTVDAGEEFTVDVTIEHTGDYEGTDEVTVIVDGAPVQTDNVTLTPGETTDLSATVTAPDVDDSSDVTVTASAGYQSESTTVAVAPTDADDSTTDDEPAPDDDEPTPDPIPGFGVPAAIVGLLFTARLLAQRQD